MKIQSLLDRYEILFSDNTKIADLRRSVVAHDISSEFRLCRNDELRKAVLNENIHSILRLVENANISGSVEDLRKVALNNDVKALFRLLPSEYEDLRKAVVDKTAAQFGISDGAVGGLLSGITSNIFPSKSNPLQKSPHHTFFACLFASEITSLLNSAPNF